MSHPEYQSDEEIFFGELSLKEVKKHVQWNGHSNFEENRSVLEVNTDPDTRIKIIETRSEPNLRPKEEEPKPFVHTEEEKVNYLSEAGSPEVNVRLPSDESFLQIEAMVANLCDSPRTSDNVELNNTLEVVDYILKNGPRHGSVPDKVVASKVVDENKNNYQQDEVQIVEKCPQTETLQSHEQLMLEGSSKKETLVRVENVTSPTEEPIKYFTPLKVPKQCEMFKSPSPRSVKTTPVFRTPAPQSTREHGWSVSKSPGRYRHVVSPVARYINNCPQVPLVTNVLPKKPLPGCSSIPKLTPPTQHPTKSHNKENVMLPQVAYKSAKKTEVINIDNERMPRTLWNKKITLPRATVMKHQIREINPNKRPPVPVLAEHADSLDNSSCLQADVSYCTEKNAFNNN